MCKENCFSCGEPIEGDALEPEEMPDGKMELVCDDCFEILCLK